MEIQKIHSCETKTEPDLGLHNFHKKRKEVCIKTRSTSASPCLHSESDIRILVRKLKKKRHDAIQKGKKYPLSNR